MKITLTLDINVTPKDKAIVQVSIAGGLEAVEGVDTTLDYRLNLDKQSAVDTTVQVKVDVANSDIEPEDINSITYKDATGTDVIVTDPAQIKDIIEGKTPIETTIKAGNTERHNHSNRHY